MGVIKGICISEKRGTAKHEIEEAVFVKDWAGNRDKMLASMTKWIALAFAVLALALNLV